MMYGNKYRAKKTEVAGIKFDSKKEANRFWELQLLQKGGYIKNLQRQVSFTLIEAYKTKDGKTERACKYIADFVYNRINPDGSVEKIVEDVKGCKKGCAYQLFKIKKKLMWDKFHIDVLET